MNKNVTLGLIFWISVVISVTIILSHNDAKAESDKIVICHATASETNPYTQNSVDASSINNENDRYLNGHGDHEGDIIPPFSYEETSFEGKNWDDKGKEIWSNGCNIVEPSPSPTPTVTPTETPTASSTPTGSPTATPTESPSPTITPTVVPSPSDTSVVIVTPPVAVPEPTIIPTPSTVPEPTATVVPVPSPTMTARPTPRPIPTVIDAGGGGMVEIPFLR